MARKPALGRGLKALIPETPRARSGLAELPIDKLQPNPAQPRTNFDPRALQELAESIREHGVLQPVLVSEDPELGYLLVAGERRWRAARLAGLRTIPAVIREHLEHGRDLELALVENLQRSDLTPLEEARAFEQLRLTRGLSQAEIAERVGIDRSTVANALRLLKLAKPVQAMLEDGRLSAGHARALLAFDSEEQRQRWAEQVGSAGLSVRDLERAAAAERQPTELLRGPRKSPPRDPNLKAAEEQLALRLGTKVEIKPQRRGGRIVITCVNQAELMRVFDCLMEDN